MKKAMNTKRVFAMLLAMIMMAAFACAGMAESSDGYSGLVMQVMAEAYENDVAAMTSGTSASMTVASMIVDYALACSGDLDTIDPNGSDSYITAQGEDEIVVYIPAVGGGYLSMSYVVSTNALNVFGVVADIDTAALSQVSSSDTVQALANIVAALSGEEE